MDKLDDYNNSDCEDDVEKIEELEPFKCAECDTLCNANQQAFENDHCGHPLCEKCRFVQESKCKNCVKSENVMKELEKDKYDTSESCDALLKAGRKRNSLKSYKHIVPIDGSPGLYTCTVCQKAIKRASTFYHFSCNSEKKPLSCDQCDKSFVKKHHLESHRLSHFGIKPFQCTQCSKAFMQKDKLKRHQKTHSDERSFVCDICSKSYKFKDDLKKHLLKHSDDKTYDCDICSRSYKSKTNLDTHKQRHTGVKTKNFTCEICGKTFATNWQLTEHRKRHQRRKHCKCTVCGRRFFTVPILKRHQQTHADVCDYECSICNTAFKRKDNLERHMKNLHVSPSPAQPSLNVPTNLQCTSAHCMSQIITDKVPATNCAESVVRNSKPSVIVSPKKLASCPVSVIVSPQKCKINKPLTSGSPTKLLPYRILPPDKRFLQMNECNNRVPTIVNLKTMHIAQTSETGEFNIETIVTTDDKVCSEPPKLFLVDAQAGCSRQRPTPRQDSTVPLVRDNKGNKCYRIINYSNF